MKRIFILPSLLLCFAVANAQFTTCYSSFSEFEEIYTITTYGEHIYVGTDKTIHRSTDNGQNWALMSGVGVNLPYSGKYKAVLAEGSNIYAGSDEGIYLSVNGGATFELKNNGMGPLQVHSILKVENAIYAGVHRMSGVTYYDQRIVLTTDNCETWVNISGDLPFSVMTVYSIAWDGTWLYAGTNIGVFRTQNQGQNWIAINNGLPEWNVYKLIVNNSVVFAGNDDGLYRWSNSEGTWTKLQNGLPEGKKVAGLVEVDSKIVASFALESVFASPDMGENWYDIGHGLNTNTLSDVAANEQYVFVLTLPIQHLMLPGKVHRRQIGDALKVPLIEKSTSKFRFFENPVQNIINIENLTGDDARVYFYSTNGNLLFQQSINKGINLIEIGHLPAGLLIIQCVGNNSNASSRILKL